MFAHPRFPEAIPPPVAPLAEKALANEEAFEATLEKWLVQRRRRWRFFFLRTAAVSR